MKRVLFAAGLGLMLGCLGVLGYTVYAKTLTDTLLHYLAGGVALGLALAALMTDSKTVLALVDRVLAWKRNGTVGGSSDKNGTAP